MRFQRFPVVVLFTLVFATAMMFGQSLTTGNVTGTVMDPTHAVVPNATVTLKSLDTGSVTTALTNSNGGYNFGLLRPGKYQVSIKQAGFAEVNETTEVEVGQTSTIDITLSVQKGAETVEVTSAAPLINTEPSINTAFTQEEVALLPSAGGDITNIAQTAPGVITNSQGGYGNFMINGLPATSNLFTVNGENDMDPYFNINNSGATNLTMGQNEISEATVIANAYGGQYGQLSGAQVTYVTKSGTNNFHGNAQWWWNGDYLNSNDWMNNNSYNGTAGSITPRPFSNANQWATSIGGPIIKNKTFFFVDYEGLRFVLPNNIHTVIPTSQFATAVLDNVTANQPNEASSYQQMVNLWSAASAGKALSPVPNNNYCVDADVPDPANPANILIPGLNGSGMNLSQYGFTAALGCAQSFQATPSALAKEYILAFRVDQKISDKDNIYFRYKLDHGTQPTYLDAISSKFDALSPQPAYDAQVNETHVFGPTLTNSLTATFSHYDAIFSQLPSALQTLPFGPIFAGQFLFRTSTPFAISLKAGKSANTSSLMTSPGRTAIIPSSLARTSAGMMSATRTSSSCTPRIIGATTTSGCSTLPTAMPTSCGRLAPSPATYPLQCGVSASTDRMSGRLRVT